MLAMQLRVAKTQYDYYFALMTTVQVRAPGHTQWDQSLVMLSSMCGPNGMCNPNGMCDPNGMQAARCAALEGRVMSLQAAARVCPTLGRSHACCTHTCINMELAGMLSPIHS